MILTAFAEFIVPIFIIIGWKTRFFCIFPIITMFVAFMFKHDGDPFSKKEKSLLYLILFISLISQIGDLIISYFKRKAKLKDTGKILPGHGGLLDRVDGLIFLMPTNYLLGKI